MEGEGEGGRLDIVIANAGVSMMGLDELSEDGYERLFATNHLGHFAFIVGVLGRYSLVSHPSSLFSMGSVGGNQDQFIDAFGSQDLW